MIYDVLEGQQAAGYNKAQRRHNMGVLAWIVVGLIAGWLAGMVVKGGGFGVIGDIVVGILGALLGGYLAYVVFGLSDAVTGINPVSILVAFIGAVLLVVIIRAVPGRKHV
jgi:uncharacterized membrane protein YeaQ/YmgE (transglycosylase-associated protein family)